MSDKKEYNFVSKPYDKTTEQLDEVIESRRIGSIRAR